MITLQPFHSLSNLYYFMFDYNNKITDSFLYRMKSFRKGRVISVRHIQERQSGQHYAEAAHYYHKRVLPVGIFPLMPSYHKIICLNI